MPFCQKVRKLGKQAYRSIGDNKALIAAFIGCSITKLYAILFSTFWLLFITSFIGTKIADANQAKTIYANVMMVSVVLGVLFTPIVGKLADRINPQFMLPVSFMARFLAIVCFMFVKDPSSAYGYVVSVLLVLGTVMESVTVDVFLLRNADK